MSKDLLLKLSEKAKQKKILDKGFISFIESIFPDKSIDVIETLKRGITRYTYKPSNRIVWTAMGENQEHLIYPKLFCSCQDFYKNVVVNKKRNYCKHILAQIISEGFNNYKEVELEESKFNELFKEFKLNI
ncbi:MAG: SWIM zinc finger family protein [Candidatus Hermodarchaeota archaeon]